MQPSTSIFLDQPMIFPFKSGQRHPTVRLHFGLHGPDDDRVLMAVKPESGLLISFRHNIFINRIFTTIGKDACVLNAFKKPAFTVSKNAEGPLVPIQIHDYKGQAMDMGDAAAEWLSAAIQQPCRMVKAYEEQPRITKRDPKGSYLRLPDGGPVSVLSHNSVEFLNKHTDQGLLNPALITQFRSNFQFYGNDCWPNMEWDIMSFKAGDVIFDIVRHIPRCEMINRLDDGSLNRAILPTVAHLHNHHHNGKRKACFGSYFAHRGEGDVWMGAQIEILEMKKWEPETEQEVVEV